MWMTRSSWTSRAATRPTWPSCRSSEDMIGDTWHWLHDHGGDCGLRETDMNDQFALNEACFVRAHLIKHKLSKAKERYLELSSHKKNSTVLWLSLLQHYLVTRSLRRDSHVRPGKLVCVPLPHKIDGVPGEPCSRQAFPLSMTSMELGRTLLCWCKIIF